MKKNLLKRSTFAFVFFFILSTFVLISPKAEGSFHNNGQTQIVKCSAQKINKCLNSRNGSENCIQAPLQWLANFITLFDFTPQFKERLLKLCLNDYSYNHYFRAILSSCSHPPTV